MVDYYGRTKRGAALLAGGALASTVLVPSVAQADTARERSEKKEKQYKVGAAVLGAATAIMVLKGDTAGGVVAGAGAYYAYKKAQKEKEAREGRYRGGIYSSYPQGYPNGTAYPSDTYPESTYPNDNTYPAGYPDYNTPDEDVYVNYPGYGTPGYDTPDDGSSVFGPPRYVAPKKDATSKAGSRKPASRKSNRPLQLK